MKIRFIQVLLVVTGWCWALGAQAAITCSAPSTSGFATVYNPTAPVPNVTQTSVNVTCTRTVATDPTVVYLRANNTNNCGGGGNTEAVLNGQCIRYEGYQNSACTTIWTNGRNGAIRITFSSVGSQTINVPVWGCITFSNQNKPAGVYTDSVPLELRLNANDGTVINTGTFSVSITNPAGCAIFPAPGNVVFNYTAFGPAVNASTTFGTKCTVGLPYTMSLDANAGVVSGLNYSLRINSLTPPVSTSNPGPSLAQTHTINGSMPAGQAGTCSTGTCTGTQAHTLTITY